MTSPLRFLFCFLSLVSTALSIGQNATITFNATQGPLSLASAGSSVQIIADETEWPAVLRVANDLAADFGRVTGTNGSMTLMNGTAPTVYNASMILNVTNLTNFAKPGSSSAAKGGTIIAGTIGNSSIIDSLVSTGKIDVSSISGTWEAFVSTVVADPLPGVPFALVIAGTSK